MKYYLHDSNSFQDAKITELFIEYGYEGLGLFYTLLEKFALQEKPIKTSVLKKQLSVGKKLEKCWSFMESLELIYSNNGETFNENILKFTEKFQKDREKTAKRISQWREKQALTENVTRSEHVRNAPNLTKLNITKQLEVVEEAQEPFEILVNLKKINDLPGFIKEKFSRTEEQLKMKVTEKIYLERQEAFILRNNERSYTNENDFKMHYTNFILKPIPEQKEKYSGQKEKVSRVEQFKNNHNAVINDILTAVGQ